MLDEIHRRKVRWTETFKLPSRRRCMKRVLSCAPIVGALVAFGRARAETLTIDFSQGEQSSSILQVTPLNGGSIFYDGNGLNVIMNSSQ